MALVSRRGLIGSAAFAGLTATAPRWAKAQAPAVITSEAARPTLPSGVQTGDMTADRAILWSRTDRPARMMVEWSTTESFRQSTKVPGPIALAEGDFTAKLDLTGLPQGQRVFYRVQFVDLADLKTTSEFVTGSLLTPPASRRNIRFVWSGDTVGQGWGINPEFGGLKIYGEMLRAEPDFFIHSGDTIYADGPIYAEAQKTDGSLWTGPDGKPWRNIVTEEKAKVAETLAEFRGNYAYNLMDEHLRRFNAAVPMLAQWDDHEVTNNWYWEQRKDQDKRYREGSVAVMAGRGMRAFHEFMPVRAHPLEQDRIYQSFRYGPSLEVFRVDFRSYRGANNDGLQTELSPEARVIGEQQMRWLKQALLASDATWKVLAVDMPIGVIVWSDGTNKKGAEAVAQGEPGTAKGRELEIAELLSFIRDNGVRNTVWLTADVHYTAAHRYDPSRAKFQEFAPFWEFVSGPLHSGSFGPNDLDATFGPEAVFVKAPPADGPQNLPPSAGYQFFGQVDIDGASEVMTVSLKDIAGATLFTQELLPEI